MSERPSLILQTGNRDPRDAHSPARIPWIPLRSSRRLLAVRPLSLFPSAFARSRGLFARPAEIPHERLKLGEVPLLEQRVAQAKERERAHPLAVLDPPLLQLRTICLNATASHR